MQYKLYLFHSSLQNMILVLVAPPHLHTETVPKSFQKRPKKVLSDKNSLPVKSAFNEVFLSER